MADNAIKLLMSFFVVAWASSQGQCASSKGNERYVRDACSVTRYRDLCIHSLAPFSTTAKTSPSLWARVGVAVTLSEAKSMVRYLARLKRQRRSSFRGRNRAALSDCIECFEDAIDELHKSLGVLRNLSRRTFSTQMADLNTWLSAALTDENTCLDGFADRNSKPLKLLLSRVSRASYFTSNALALANKLATTGLGSAIDNDP